MTHPMPDIDKQLLRHALSWALTIAALVGLLAMGGCALLPRFVPQCDGEPSAMPCRGACRVRVPDTHGLVVREIPEAVVILDHTGQVRCQEVS